jgi:hypothetical protein
VIVMRKPNRPSPADALDTGTIHDLTQASRKVPLSAAPPRKRNSRHFDIAVPERASRLLEGFGGYGC